MMSLKVIDNIFICHYTKLSNRLPYLNNQLSNFNINPKWITDYDKEQLTEEILLEYLPKYNTPFTFHGNTRKLRLPEISIMMKHISIWKFIIENEIENSLILEDDIVFDTNFVDKFNTFIEDYDKHYDFIWVGSCCDLNAKFTGKHLVKVNQSRCAHAYMISQKCAKTLLDNIKDNNLPVDIFFNVIIHKYNMNSYWMEPDLIKQNPIFETSIQNKN